MYREVSQTNYFLTRTRDKRDIVTRIVDEMGTGGKWTRPHGRRIKTEKMAKVVASVWGKKFIQFLAALPILPRTILKNRMNSSFSVKSS